MGRAVVELAYTFSQDGETERTGAAGVELRTVDGESKVATVVTAPGYYQGRKVAQAMAYR